MSDPFSAALIGISSSLITIAATAKWQKHFWTSQRKAELQFAAISEVNRLTADFITEHIRAESSGVSYVPSADFFKSFQAASSNVRVLFSDASWSVFKEMEVMIGPNLGPRSKNRNVDDFIQAKERALKALYRESGISPQ